MCNDDLVDFRTKVHRKTHSVLFAKAQATGRDMQDLAREVLAKWAEGELHAATVMERVLRSEGVLGESGGNRGGVHSPAEGKA